MIRSCTVRKRFSPALVLASALLGGVAPGVLLTLPGTVQAADTLRPEVGKPLQEAQTLIQQKKYRDALAKVSAAAAIPRLTEYESFVIEQMRAAAASGAGDSAAAVKAFEAQIASGRLTPEATQQALAAIVQFRYTGKDYAGSANAIQRYVQAGGSDSRITGLLAQALYLQGDYARAATELRKQVAATQRAGQEPTETQLTLLASCALKQNDSAGYRDSLELLVRYHPKKDYWLDLISRTSNQSGFSDRLALDVYRLRRETGTLDNTSAYMEAIQLALQAGLPGEAQLYTDEATKAGLFGAGDDVERQQRLKTLVEQKVAEDRGTLDQSVQEAAAIPSGDALVRTGLAYIGYGDTTKGLALVEQGVKKGGLRRADEVQLHLGYAYYRAGRNQDAIKTWQALGADAPSAALAKLWILQVQSSS